MYDEYLLFCWPWENFQKSSHGQKFFPSQPNLKRIIFRPQIYILEFSKRLKMFWKGFRPWELFFKFYYDHQKREMLVMQLTTKDIIKSNQYSHLLIFQSDLFSKLQILRSDLLKRSYPWRLFSWLPWFWNFVLSSMIWYLWLHNRFWNIAFIFW